MFKETDQPTIMVYANNQVYKQDLFHTDENFIMLEYQQPLYVCKTNASKDKSGVLTVAHGKGYDPKLLTNLLGKDVVLVPYKNSGAMLKGILGGDVDMMVNNQGKSFKYMASGEGPCEASNVLPIMGATVIGPHIAVQQIRKEIREFNKSAWMATQCPMPDSQTWVKLLAVEGWTFIPITSQTSDIPAQLVRKKRLQELFGEDTFKNYFILDTGMDKDSALSEFHNTGLYWVEDKPKNALAGLNYGLKPILIDHPYNRDFNHPDIVRVNNWKQIHEMIAR